MDTRVQRLQVEGVQMTQVTTRRAAIYCRVSTEDQSCDRQKRDLTEFASNRGFEVSYYFQETASGAKNDRVERAKVLQLARERKIDAILVTELTRWGRSTEDLLGTLKQLADWGVSLIAQTGMEFDLSTPQGKLLLTVIAGFSQFERDLIRERTMSGLAAAKARGKKLGRQQGQCPSDKYAKKVMHHLEAGRSVRWIAHELQISPTTIQAIKKRRAS
jgi:DNA invertase Pin-like site-specific DNA recombinase